MLRRSRVFRHLFLDVAAHPNLIFRSFLKVLERNRVDITHRMGAADTPRKGSPGGAAQLAPAGSLCSGASTGYAVGSTLRAQPLFAIPTEYTVFLSAGDYVAVCAAGESRVAADLLAQFRRFLLTAAGAVYDTPANAGLSFRLAADTDLGLERNEYYFAWPRVPMPGLAGRLDLLVRGVLVETFDVPEVPPLGIGTTRTEQIRLTRLADEDAFLPDHVSLWLIVEGGQALAHGGKSECQVPGAGYRMPGPGTRDPEPGTRNPRPQTRSPQPLQRVSLVNRSNSEVPVLVDGRPVEADGARPVHDGSRIAVGPDLVFVFHAESPDLDALVEPRPFTEAELDRVLGILGGEWGDPSPGKSGDSMPGSRAETGDNRSMLSPDFRGRASPSQPRSPRDRESARPGHSPGPSADGKQDVMYRPGSSTGAVSEEDRETARPGKSGRGTYAARAVPRCLEVVGTVLTRQMFDHAPEGVVTLGSSLRCHLVLRGAGLRPVQADLALAHGQLWIGNRSGRRAVYLGAPEVALRPGARRAVNPGDLLRLADLRLRLEAPPADLSGEITRYFGANHLGNLLFDRPQARLILDGAGGRRSRGLRSHPGTIVIGRYEAPSRLSAISIWRRLRIPSPAAGRKSEDSIERLSPVSARDPGMLSPDFGEAAPPVGRWLLPSPYLWPAHAELVLTQPPRIQPHHHPVHGCRAVLFVNMADVIGAGQSRLLSVGDHLILGNLILRCR